MMTSRYLRRCVNGKITPNSVPMTCLRRVFLIFLVAALAGCATTQPPEPAKPYVAADTSRTIDLTHPPRDLWDRVRRGFAIPNLNTELVQHWTDYYASHPESVLLMTQRASKYLYHIVDELEQRGLPSELALLPFVESAYKPDALSRSQASGLWQFIPSTGRHYNLQQDWWQDQRRDPIASTAAALDYLAYLYDFQGDWYLALASYNWGEGAVKRALEKNLSQGIPADYLTLPMPEETRNYVPKLQAIKNIIAQPVKYGLTLPDVSNTPYFTAVRRHSTMDVEVAARLAEIPVEEFKALNASYNQPVILAEHQPTLLLPADKVDIFNRNLSEYKGRLSAWKVHTPKQGETYVSIAKQYGISVAQLRKINGLGKHKTMVSSLLVPDSTIEQTGGIQRVALDTTPDVTPVAAVARRNPNTVRTHTIKAGDTLYALARRYNTTVNELRKLNNLKSDHLARGKRLRVPGTGVRS